MSSFFLLFLQSLYHIILLFFPPPRTLSFISSLLSLFFPFSPFSLHSLLSWHIVHCTILHLCVIDYISPPSFLIMAFWVESGSGSAPHSTLKYDALDAASSASSSVCACVNVTKFSRERRSFFFTKFALKRIFDFKILKIKSFEVIYSNEWSGMEWNDWRTGRVRN